MEQDKEEHFQTKKEYIIPNNGGVVP